MFPANFSWHLSEMCYWCLSYSFSNTSNTYHSIGWCSSQFCHLVHRSCSILTVSTCSFCPLGPLPSCPLALAPFAPLPYHLAFSPLTPRGLVILLTPHHHCIYIYFIFSLIHNICNKWQVFEVERVRVSGKGSERANVWSPEGKSLRVRRWVFEGKRVRIDGRYTERASIRSRETTKRTRWSRSVTVL